MAGQYFFWRKFDWVNTSIKLINTDLWRYERTFLSCIFLDWVNFTWFHPHKSRSPPKKLAPGLFFEKNIFLSAPENGPKMLKYIKKFDKMGTFVVFYVFLANLSNFAIFFIKRTRADKFAQIRTNFDRVNSSIELINFSFESPDGRVNSSRVYCNSFSHLFWSEWVVHAWVVVHMY